MNEVEKCSVPVLYDPASTVCFVAHHVLARIAPELDDLGVELDWQPIDLADLCGWHRGMAAEGNQRANALRIATELGVSAQMPALWMDSRPASAIAISLGSTPKGLAWRERAFSAVFEEGRDISSAEELCRLGMDLEVDVVSLVTPDTLGMLDHATQTARSHGVTGGPAMMFDEFPIVGIQEASTMLGMIRRWVTKSRDRNRAPE